jgi:hypothetical protein
LEAAKSSIAKLYRPQAMLPPPYQRPPGAEIRALGFAALLKILVKANLLLRVAAAKWARGAATPSWAATGAGAEHCPPSASRSARSRSASAFASFASRSPSARVTALSALATAATARAFVALS